MTCFQMTIKCMFVLATANKSIASFLFSSVTFFLLLFSPLRSVIVLVKLPDVCYYLDKCEISLISRM